MSNVTAVLMDDFHIASRNFYPENLSKRPGEEKLTKSGVGKRNTRSFLRWLLHNPGADIMPISGWPGIAYYAYNIGTSSYGIKYAGYFCTPHNCSWGIAPIVTSSSIMTKYRYPSLKIGADRMPRITYHGDMLLNDTLYYAVQVNTGGNCGPAGSWQCDAIDSGDQVGMYPDLALTAIFTPLDNPYIAYYDGGNGNLKYAHFVNTIWPGNCGTGPLLNKWQCDGIKNTTASGWLGIDLDAYSDGTRAIVFGCPDCSGKGIFYTQNVGVGGTNCLDPAWSCESIQSDPFTMHDLSQFVELDISDTNVATVAYYDADGGDVWIGQKNLATYLPFTILK
ncbi:MAG: hypothetical protein P1S60_00380 [Anaerolineae bacterium]|nr:hypothetical protein [Anaerolineae bacterium]